MLPFSSTPGDTEHRLVGCGSKRPCRHLSTGDMTTVLQMESAGKLDGVDLLEYLGNLPYLLADNSTVATSHHR